MSVHPVFDGNCPRNVAKDAKYAIRSGKHNPVVALTYWFDNNEKWYATTDEHPRLVEMVNRVKVDVGDRPNGPFYINEYGQVLVPVGQDVKYYLAGEYTEPLLFAFEGKVLSGNAVDLGGTKLTPGDRWVGPKPGIPYVLAAGGTDIYFRTSPRPNVEVQINLSEEVGATRAADLAKQIRSLKGFQGGKVYVNEWGQLFAPVKTTDTYESIYIGRLSLEEGWFRKRTGLKSS